MKKFNITVNGKSYEVDVEEVGGVSTSSPRPVQSTVVPTAVTKASAAAPAHASAAAPAPASATGGETIYAPMPGTIFDIKVAVGDNIKSGDVLVILEAMKMENEIMAQNAGKVLSINVNKGASVNSGDVLVAIG